MTTGSSAPRNIVLAGFMGAGKTTVGQIVATRLGWPFVDTDDWVERAAGQPVAAIFAQQGEATFRQMERDACARAAALERHVIATGGGALLDPATRAAFLAGGLVIGLRAALDTILRRLDGGVHRPLFNGNRAQLGALYAARAPVYAALPHQVETDGHTPGAIAEEVIRLWNQHTS
ncbi:MAG TPA: shikimate kinase [Aggregatilineaceae bacterium]|nr:shikimate kinase [Aggregatilineaceae bacterium]